MPRLLPLLLAGCATAQDGDTPFNKKDLKDPQKTLDIFKELVRRGDSAKAHNYLLSKEAKATIKQEEFQIALSMYEVIPRLILGLENHGVAGDRMRICNPEFGISREIGIKSEIGGRIWTLDFTRDDLTYFQRQAMAWFRKQTQTAGNRFYVYPPGWRYSKVRSHCGCKSHG